MVIFLYLFLPFFWCIGEKGHFLKPRYPMQFYSHCYLITVRFIIKYYTKLCLTNDSRLKERNVEKIKPYEINGRELERISAEKSITCLNFFL